MPASRKWWFLPPAVGLLLVLGPLSTPSPGSTPASTTPATPPAVAGPAVESPRPAPSLPPTPDLWQLTSTLIGVLLLGVAVVFVVRRLRGPAATAGQGIVALRQTLRLSARRALHAVEFEGRLLLLAEGEQGVRLLQAGNPPEQETVADPAIPRAPATADEDGAVPRNLLLPRPSAPRGRAAVVPPPQRGLGDFRALLAKAGH